MQLSEGMPARKQHMALFPTALETWKSSVKEQVRPSALCFCCRALFLSPPKKRNLVSSREGTESDKSGYYMRWGLLQKYKFLEVHAHEDIYGDQERALELLELEIKTAVYFPTVGAGSWTLVLCQKSKHWAISPAQILFYDFGPIHEGGSPLTQSPCRSLASWHGAIGD